jgi:hypothetical protein
MTSPARRARAQQITEIADAVRQRLVDIGIDVNTVAVDYRIETVCLEDVELSLVSTHSAPTLAAKAAGIEARPAEMTWCLDY